MFIDERVIVAVFIGVILFGAYCGVVIYNDARTLQNNLEKVDVRNLNFDSLEVPVQAPMMVRASESYTLEIYLDEALARTSKLPAEDDEPVDIVVGGNLQVIKILGEDQFTTTVPSSRVFSAQPPHYFVFEVRKNIKELPDNIVLDVALIFNSDSVFDDEVDVPVYEDGDFLRQHWWYIIFLSATIATVSLILVLLLAAVFRQDLIAGSIVTILLLAIGIRIYPPLKEIIDTVAPFLKAFVPSP
jgi:hypothetical protein